MSLLCEYVFFALINLLRTFDYFLLFSPLQLYNAVIIIKQNNQLFQPALYSGHLLHKLHIWVAGGLAHG